MFSCVLKFYYFAYLLKAFFVCLLVMLSCVINGSGSDKDGWGIVVKLHPMIFLFIFSFFVLVTVCVLCILDALLS